MMKIMLFTHMMKNHKNHKIMHFLTKIGFFQNSKKGSKKRFPRGVVENFFCQKWSKTVILFEKNLLFFLEGPNLEPEHYYRSIDGGMRIDKPSTKTIDFGPPFSEVFPSLWKRPHFLKVFFIWFLGVLTFSGTQKKGQKSWKSWVFPFFINSWNHWKWLISVF
jgi:hypothetical protein